MSNICHTAGYIGAGVGPTSMEGFADMANAVACLSMGHAESYANGALQGVEAHTGLIAKSQLVPVAVGTGTRPALATNSWTSSVPFGSLPTSEWSSLGDNIMKVTPIKIPSPSPSPSLH